MTLLLPWLGLQTGYQSEYGNTPIGQGVGFTKKLLSAFSKYGTATKCLCSTAKIKMAASIIL